jgi:hypothetical protein
MRSSTIPLKSLSSLLSTQNLTSTPFLGKVCSRSISSISPADPRSPDPDSQMDPPTSPIHVAIDAGSSVRKPISLWPGMYHSPVTNALWEARSSIFERLLDPPAKDGPPQSELLTKSPSQSRTSIIYKFSSDYILREQYRDPWNEVRIGKLLEDLDALAGTIAVKVKFSDNYCYFGRTVIFTGISVTLVSIKQHKLRLIIVYLLVCPIILFQFSQYAYAI